MTATLIAMAVMLALIALEVPIAVAMLVTGVVGCLSVLGWSPTLPAQPASVSPTVL